MRSRIEQTTISRSTIPIGPRVAKSYTPSGFSIVTPLSVKKPRYRIADLADHFRFIVHFMLSNGLLGSELASWQKNSWRPSDCDICSGFSSAAPIDLGIKSPLSLSRIFKRSPHVGSTLTESNRLDGPSRAGSPQICRVCGGASLRPLPSAVVLPARIPSDTKSNRIEQPNPAEEEANTSLRERRVGVRRAHDLSH
jgi:hypothetical protein